MGDSTKPFSDTEITVCLENFCNFPVTSEQLRAPTPSFVQNVLECFMKDLQLNVDAITMPSWKCMQFLENPEYYEGSLPLVTYFSVASQLLKFAGITDLTLKDLTEPKPKRTKKILSYLITMWKHVLTKFQKYKMLDEQTRSEREEKERLFQKMTDMKEELRLLQEKRVDFAEREKQKKIGSDLDKIMKELEVKKDMMHEKYNKVKAEIADCKKSISDLNVEFIIQKENLAKLDSAILKSPNRLKSEIDDLKSKISEANDELMTMRKKVQDSRQEAASLVQREEHLKKAVVEVKECTEKCNLMYQDATLIAEFDDAIKLNTDEINTTDLETASYEDQMRLYEKESNQLELKMKSNADYFQKTKSILLERIGKESKVLKSVTEENLRMQQVLTDMNKEFSEQEAAAKEIHERKKEQLLQLGNVFDNFMKGFHEDIDSAMDTLKGLLDEDE